MVRSIELWWVLSDLVLASERVFVLTTFVPIDHIMPVRQELLDVLKLVFIVVESLLMIFVLALLGDITATVFKFQSIEHALICLILVYVFPFGVVDARHDHDLLRCK